MKNIKQMIEYPKQGILSKEIVKTDKINTTLFCMAQGTEISEHTSTKQGFVYILEGSGLFNLEKQKIEMKPGTLIEMPKNAKHSLKAEENTSFLLILVS